MPKGVSSNLDFLRAVAVLLVLAQHLTQRLYDNPSNVIPTSHLGLFGVLIFFVHTSLVLMYSMERGGLQGKALLSDFYIRRIFRIYPLSILAILAALALHLDSNIHGIAGLSAGPAPGWKAIVAQLLLVQNVVHVKSIVNVLWSLPFEIQMYLLLPFLFAWVQRGRVVGMLLVVWAASVFPAWAQPHVPILASASLLLFGPCFLAGILAFALPRQPRLRSFLWPMFVCALVVSYALRPVLSTGWFLCLLLGLGIPFFQEIHNKPLRLISNRIAVYSYGIYVSHQFCIWFAIAVLAGRPAWLRIAVLTTSLVLIPILLYHGIEKPMIRAGIWLASRRTQKPEAVLAVAA